MLDFIGLLQDWLVSLFGSMPYKGAVANFILLIVITLIFWLVYKIVFSVFNALSNKVLKPDSQVQPFRIQLQEILSANEVATIIGRTYKVLSWLLRAVIVVTWLNIVFGVFEWTHRISRYITELFLSILKGLFTGFTSYIPDLATAIVIVLISTVIIKLFRVIFDGLDGKRINLPGFYPEWSRTSFNLIRVLIVAMTIVVVFPYLPGSNSPAFQGVTIFVGVLLSLGSTSAVANVVAGIVITYTRAFKSGDHVRIAHTDGKIIERSAFVTRLVTPKNVQVSVPNAAVLADKVINYSTQAQLSGLTLHTGVTIGYDVPWPKVHELLLTAASQTKYVATDPAPFVLQTALEDNYVAYELNATTQRADIRPQIYSDLHGNILNAFHTAGVEITSPQYRAIRDGNEAAMAPVLPKSTETLE